MKDFNKIVKNLSKKGGKVVFKKDIFELIDPEYKKEYEIFLNKTIYRLKSEGIIISLKAGVYIVPDTEDIGLNEIDLVEKYYVKLLKKYITETTGSAYYISGQKSLEIHMRNVQIPEKVYIVNRTINKKILLGKREIIFKTISGNEMGKKINLYSKFSKYIRIMSFDGIDFKFSCLELAMLESALVSDCYEGLDIGLLIKTIKKYKSILREEIFRDIGKYKYNMSFNRLKEISKTLDENLYKIFLDIIKKNGGCFIGEGVRGI